MKSIILNGAAIIIMMLAILIAINTAFAGETVNNAPGRWLPDGRWQPRNMHATLPEPAPGMAAQENAPDSRKEIQSINWGPDIKLTDYPPIFAFYSAVTESPNGYVHVIADHDPTFTGIYLRSTDYGQTWGELIYLPGLSVTYPILFARSNFITLLQSHATSNVSTDYGVSWNWVYIYPLGAGLPNATILNNRIYSSPTTEDHRAFCYYSDDYGQAWQYHSQSVLGFYDEVSALGSTNLGLHMLVSWASAEVFYEKYSFSNPGWSSSIMISGDTTHFSFLPKMTAWGDSNLFAIWVDYEYSPYPWTGDLICRRSTDNGETWLPEQQITFNHLALNKNICSSGDSIFLVYDEIVLDGRTDAEEIFFNLSSDGGISWGQPVRLTYADWRSINPYITVVSDRIHISFCDARGDTTYHIHNSVYYKKGLISPEGVSWDEEENLPEELSLKAYPNPFNDETMITIEGIKGGDLAIRIYDIQGKLIRTFRNNVEGGGEKVVWDATDASGKKVSSGLYFARASTRQIEETIKLLYLK